MKKTTLLFLTLFLVSIGCFSDTGTIKKEIAVASPAIKLEKPKTNTATLILSKKEIPVLCYHNIRAIQPNASVTVKAYTVTPKAFEEQMKALSDAGYQTILPDELYAYLVYHKPLPAKPILITFDDTREEHFRLATPEMAKYGFKGVFFIIFHQHIIRRNTGLPCVHGFACPYAVDSFCHISARRHHDRGFAAKLKGDRGQILCRGFHDMFAHCGRAGKK